MDIIKAYRLSVGFASIHLVAAESKTHQNIFPIDLAETMLTGFHQTPCGDSNSSNPVFLFDQERIVEGDG